LKRTLRITAATAAAGILTSVLSACSSLGLGNSCTWTLERMAAQVVVVPVDQSNIAAATPAVAAGAGGVILFGGHTPQNLNTELATLVKQAPDGHPPAVMSDEEGGDVQRLRDVVDELGSARWMADHLSTAQIRETAKTLGANMKTLGVTMNLAPVLDLDGQDISPNKVNADGNRSFGIDPIRTSEAGVAFAQGLQDGGVTPVVKHFPGLGGTVGNTDYVPAHTLPWDQLQGAGLLPFKAAIDAGIPAVMTANAGVPGLTNLPASLSPDVVKVLREQLHFDGLIMTDTLTAAAVSANGFSPETAAVAAIGAGVDMVLYGGPSTGVQRFTAITAAIVTAVNNSSLPRDRLLDAANKVLTTKNLDSCGL
jgi:beta-N-acetylhexosaminidase